jgi:hypothetical protein
MLPLYSREVAIQDKLGLWQFTTAVLGVFDPKEDWGKSFHYSGVGMAPSDDSI